MAVVANVAINVDAANAIQQLKRVDQASSGLNKGFASAAAGAKGVGAAIQSALGPLLAVTAAVAALKQGFDLLGQKEADVANLERGLTGLVNNSKEAAKTLVGIADQLGKQTLFNEEDFTQGFKLLTSFRSIATDSYERVAVAAADVATVTNQDVNSSLMQLAKALQDPEKGLTALARSGTQFTEQQKTQIKTLVESGDQLGAQNLILKEIETQYGGASKAAGASGFAGVMDTLGEVVRDLQRAFAAILQSPLQAFFSTLGTAVQRIAEGYEWLNSVLKSQILPILQPLIDKVAELTGGFDVTTIVDLWQGGLVIAVNLVAKALELVVPAAVWVLDTFAAIGNNPVFQALIAPLKAVISGLLGARTEITQFTNESKGSADALKSSEQAAAALKTKTEDAEEAAKRLKEEQQKVTKAIEDATKATEASANVVNAVADQRAKIESAYLNTQKEINGVLLSQAERQLAAAKTQEEKIAAARKVYDLTVKQAKIEYDINIAAIRAEVEKANLAAQTAAQKVKQVEAVVLLAQAEGKVVDAHYQALNATKEALNLAEIQAGTAVKVAYQQERGARAAYDGKLQAAQAAYQNNILAENTTSAANAASQFAGNMERGAGAAQQAVHAAGTLEHMAANIRTPLGGEKTQTFTYTDDEMRRLGIGPYANAATRAAHQAKLSAERNAAASGTSNTISAFARGGLITKPTLALMGEGGENEFVIPQSKAGAFAANYLASNRNGATTRDVSVNIQTGPVTQMDGANYVSTDDLGAAVQAGVNQTLSLLAGDSSVRRSLGLA